jgi:hypothetical protein
LAASSFQCGTVAISVLILRRECRPYFTGVDGAQAPC